MRFLKYILPLLLSTNCFAQSRPIRNDTPTALRDLGSNLNVGANYAVNQFGQIQATLVAGSGGATSAVHLEDVLAVDGDAGITVFCRANNAGTVATSGGDGDYTVPACTATGALQTAGIGQGLGVSVYRLEDDAFASGNGVIVAAAVRQDTLSTDQANGDIANLKVDGTGRLLITNATPGETWQSCGTATATTADVAIKAAVASNRIYVTSITCKSTSATVATSLDFKDATTVIAVGGIAQMATASPGSFTATFPIPLRGTVNTAFNFATNISTSSVTCCGAGYISVN